jgi:hypothetical protein
MMPRGICPGCNGWKRIKPDGTIWKHRRYYTVRGTYIDWKDCPGSGQPQKIAEGNK